MHVPRRALDWYRATRISAVVTITLCVLTIVFALSASASGATSTPISFVDLAVLIGITAQTITIGYFAGALSNRLRNLEGWRKEHLEWTDRTLSSLTRIENLEDVVRRIEVIEKRCESEAFRNSPNRDHR